MNEKIIQKMLAGFGYYKGKIDGIRGSRTRKAIEDALRERATGQWSRWGTDRVEIALEQLVYLSLDMPIGEIDGLAGQLTAHCREIYPEVVATGKLPSWRDSDPVLTADPIVPKKTPFPRESDCVVFYGQPGLRGSPDEREMQSRLVAVACPWQLTIAWDTSKKTSRIRIHRKCADSLLEVLERQHAHYGENQLRAMRMHLYGGSYEPRKKRNGSSWSMHAFGCAIDFDPSNNPLKMSAPRAPMSRSEYDDWWKIWEAAGWLSLGRARNFDWMHVQAANL